MMLVLPEELVPNSPVIGASLRRASGQDLKFENASWVSMAAGYIKAAALH
jgi:hypothetical protein